MTDLRFDLLRLLSVALAFALSISVAAAEPRYEATWADGSRTTGDELLDWGSATSQPRLGDRRLFDPANPIRSLRETRLAAEPLAESFIEFIGGDVLPGKVVGFATGGTDDYDALPAHLLVEPLVKVELPGMPARPTIRVLPDFVRRVVFRSSDDPRFRPGTLLLVDGRKLALRSLRWSDAGVRALTEAGPVSVALADLVEAQLPSRDPWELHARRLGMLDPEGTSQLLMLETPDGLRATTSLERLIARSTGDANNPDTWYHVIQPAWSLDALFLSHRRVGERRLWPTERLPLAGIEPSASRHRAVFSAAWQQPRNGKNVQGGPLVSGSEPFAWGFGVQAWHELEFALPPLARAFRTHLGLDAAAGTGGCARGIVGAGKRELFRSPLLVGSGKVIDTGRLALEGGDTSLTLVTDWANDDRPAGTDPYDVRDIFDWLEPELELDRAGLRQAVVEQMRLALAGLDAWEFDGPYGKAWRLVNVFDPSRRARPSFDLAIRPIGGPVTMTRRVHVEAGREAFVLLIGRPESSSGPLKVRVTVDDRKLGEVEIPVWRDDKRGPPIMLRLKGLAGRDVDIELELVPAGDRSALWYAGSALVEREPQGAQAIDAK